jgi:hypothetical protein
MALVDTGCTSRMQSKAWLLAYSKTLPDGYQCELTEGTKLFHFADGPLVAPFVCGRFLSFWEALVRCFQLN